MFTKYVIFIICTSFTFETSDNYFVLTYLKEEKHFAIGRLNDLWNKALKILKSEKELIDLYGDLMVQDSIEFKSKQEQVKEQDHLKRSFNDKKLIGVLLKHGLSRICPENLSTYINKDLHDISELYFEAFYRDQRLKNLWKQASIAGFTGGELQTLKVQFVNYLEKKKEYERLRTEFKNIDGTSDISVSPKDGQLLKKLNKQLKDIHVAMKSVYYEIQVKLSEKISGDVAIASEYRVVQLWNQALNQNLSGTDLTSFKEELGYLNNQLIKYHYATKEAEIAKLYSKLDQGDYDNWLSLDRKAKNLAAKVKKWHYKLRTKLSNLLQHVEL